MGDRTGDKYQKWGVSRLLSGILTILEEWFDRIVANAVPSLVDFGLRANDPILTMAHGSNPLLSQISHVNKFGANATSADGVDEDVWNRGGVYSFPTAAIITHIWQATDQVATDGGATIEIDGETLDGTRLTQTADLNAVNTTTKVAIPTPLWRVFRMRVLENIVAADEIVIGTSAGVIYAQMEAGDNQTLMAIFTVPVNTTGYITNYYCDYVRDAVKDPDSIDFRLEVADRDNSYEFQLKHKKGIPKQAPGFQHWFKPYLKVTEKSDIKISAIPDNADASVHAGFDIILVAD